MTDQKADFLKSVKKWFSGVIIDNNHRDKIVDFVCYLSMSLISSFMTVVNLAVQDYVLMTATLVFSLLCIVNLAVLFINEKARKIVHYLFIMEFTCEIIFFIITGNPEGFSAIWAAMVPLALYMRSDGKEGSIICLLVFLVCVFFYWVPIGRNLLMYEYTSAWMLRFPMFYLSVMLVSCLLHTIQSLTMQELNLLRGNLQEQVDIQTEELLEKNRKLEAMNDEIIEAIGDLVEGRSIESGTHVKRVKSYSKLLAETVQYVCPQYHLTDDDVIKIASASAVHDIGKIMIKDSILMKKGKFTPEEFEEMKTHSEIGCEMLGKFSNLWDEEYGTIGHDICRYHHERWDGNGYPLGLKGDEIPVSAQIVALADVYDALTNDRVYRKALPHEKACEMIINGECGVFSPEMLACFVKCRDRFGNMQNTVNPKELNEFELQMICGGLDTDKLPLNVGRLE